MSQVVAEAIPARWRPLVERVVGHCRAGLGGELVALALFGSVARGEPTVDSDLDLYVVTRTPPTALADPRLDWALGLRETPEYRTLADAGYRPEPMPIVHSVQELAAHPWILLDIAHHGIVLHDPEGVLTRELAAVRRRLIELGARRVELSEGGWYWDLKPDWRPGDVIEL